MIAEPIAEIFSELLNRSQQMFEWFLSRCYNCVFTTRVWKQWEWVAKRNPIFEKGHEEIGWC